MILGKSYMMVCFVVLILGCLDFSNIVFIKLWVWYLRFFEYIFLVGICCVRS